MCTVTYIPPTKESSFVLTSNRDEREFRPTLPPGIYQGNNCKMGYPKDEKAGGSWIAMNDKGNINCLLNGGIVAHQKQEFHTKSRGTILLEFTQSLHSTYEYFSQIDLGSVEPFTIVALKQREGTIQDFTEFIWDGNDKHFRQLDITQSYIWSSVTLYNEEHRKTRKEWFERFYKEHKSNITKEKIFDFHSGHHTNDNAINVIMQREGGLKTVSITQISALGQLLQMNYSDLLNNTVKVIEL